MRNVYYGDYNYMIRLDANRKARIERERVVRQQKIMLAFGIFITILILSIFSIKAFVYASSEKSDSNKQYKSICIYCGDTLDSISEEYYSDDFKSIKQLKKEIRSINHIDYNDELIPGNYIVIPYYL